MMRRYIFALTMSLQAVLSVTGQGIEFFHGTWEEALLKAKEEDKIIFIDAFTTWCGPCKAMAANTFPDPQVGAFFNRYFINMKIDMEKEMGLEFRKSFPVSAFPTLYFIDYDKEVVSKSVGAKKPKELIQLGEQVLSKYDKSTKYEAAYNSGDRSFELVYNYVAALNRVGKPSVKIANDYLASQSDLTTPDNLKFILEAASQVDCQCFELMEKYKSQIEKIAAKETIEHKIRLACENTVKRAIEFETADLIELAYDAMKRHLGSEAEYFKSKSEIQYALSTNDLVRIQDLVSIHTKKFLKDDSEGLHQLALDIHKYGDADPSCREIAIDLASKAAKDQEAKYVSTYAELVFKNGRKVEAIQILDHAIRKLDADKDSKDLQDLKALRSKIENS